MPIYAGIDVGVQGAIGFVDESGAFLDVLDLPMLKTSTGRQALDRAELVSILRAKAPAFVTVELVGVRPGEGAVGAFAFGKGQGIILGILTALGIPHNEVQPQVWKKLVGIPAGSPKDVSIATAKRLLPGSVEYLKRKKDDGRAEALLMAYRARIYATT
jgi:hypothetical protein